MNNDNNFNVTSQIIRKMDTPRYLGILYHWDSENDPNYALFLYGDTKEELEIKSLNMDTPKYSEELKIFEYGIDIKESLHEYLLDEENQYNYNDCIDGLNTDELNHILNLNFKTCHFTCFKLNK